LRVGFDARAIDWSGIGTYSRNLLLEYAQTDLDVVVFCQDQQRDLVPSSPSFSFISANSNPLAPAAGSVFGRLVESVGLDLVHVPSYLAPSGTSVPLVVTIHDVIPLIYPRSTRNPLVRRRYRSQLAQTLAAARCVITVSQISKSTLSAYAGVDPLKVRVIHNGVSTQFRPVADPARLDEVRRRYRLPARYALWIGEFRPQKNLEFLLLAWSAAMRRIGDAPDLVLAGTQEGEFRKIQREASRRGLDGHVHFPGFIRDGDLAAVYSGADLFVFPSLYEGFGLPPLEAMACGTPCVVSNSSALPEVTGRAAMMFNPTSVEQLVECVATVLHDVDLNGKLRREGLRQSAMFSWEKAAAETVEVYRAAVE
jgi:glycosyltransferase involved in cell wall biosynthesis